MIRGVILFVALALPIFSHAAQAPKFKVDESHSTVGFKIKHLMIANVSGRFNKFNGTFSYDEKTGKLENLEVKADASSIDTNEPKRDNHLKGSDFFDVEKYPSITFVSKTVDYKAKKPVRIMGNLTIHGQTKPIVLAVNFKGSAKDPWGNNRLVFEANSKINRKDFGLTWNKALESGGVLVGDEVSIVIDGQAVEDKQ